MALQQRWQPNVLSTTITNSWHAEAVQKANSRQATRVRQPFASTTIASSVSSAAATTYFQRQRANEVLALKLTLLVQQVLAAHVAIKILAVFTAAAPIVYAGGLLYSVITDSPIQLGLLKVYSVIIRVPGAKVTEEKSLAAGVLMNAFFLAGVFSFAVLIGIVSEEIKLQLKGVRIGNYPVVTADHTLVLNWNRQSTSLLRKMVQDSHGCSKSLGRELVILAEESKDKMDSAILPLLDGSRLRVVTREGAPHSLSDLDAVSAARAKTVILLHPDNAKDADARKTATILGLEAARSHPSMSIGAQRVIVQNPECLAEGRQAAGQSKSLMDLAHQTVKGREMRLVEVNGNRNIARLIAQSAVQPGVASVYSNIAQSTPGAPDFYLRDCGEELHGKTYQEARRSYTEAVVCGLVRHSDRATQLNPSDNTKLHAADRLIVLAHKGDAPSQLGGPQAAPAAPNMEELRQRLQAAVPPEPRPKTVVVLGWGGGVADIASAISEFATAGSEVIFVSQHPPADLPESTPKCSFRYLQGSPFDHDACRRAGVADCHAIIMGTLECEEGKAADARTLASLLVVQDLVSDRPLPASTPHVVAAIHRQGTVRTARHILKDLGRDRLTAELLQPNELASGMLLQVANEPGLAPALSELIDNSIGQEIYLRRPERYSLDSGHSATFAEVVELARLRGETALGYVTGDGSLALAPEAMSRHHFTKSSRVVVMAES
ncbi:hypothetical protein N2152v2_005986 [Parachlorella kessleri]